MKTIAIHSQKGGVGKTTLALLLAKSASKTGRACILDYDFIGTGMANLIPLNLPKQYLEHYLTSAEPSRFPTRELFGSYSDDDLKKRAFSVVLNHGKPRKATRENEGLHEALLAMMSDEPQYGQIAQHTKALFNLLKEEGFDLVIVDCHPGLGLVSETMIPLVDLNVYVTTQNRSDCFGLLKTINRKGFDQSSSFLVLNKAEPVVTDLTAFRFALESDGLVSIPAKALLAQFKHIARDEKRFALIPESQQIRLLFYLGGPGMLPRVEDSGPFSVFCKKALALLS